MAKCSNNLIYFQIFCCILCNTSTQSSQTGLMWDYPGCVRSSWIVALMSGFISGCCRERKKEGRELVLASVAMYYEQKAHMSFVMKPVCCADLWLSDVLSHHNSSLTLHRGERKGKKGRKEKKKTLVLGVRVDSDRPFISAMTKYHFAKWRPWAQSINVIQPCWQIIGVVARDATKALLQHSL